MCVTSTTAPATSSLSIATHSPDVAFRVARRSGRQTSGRGSCTLPLPPKWRTEGKAQLDDGGALPDALRPQSSSAENAQFLPGRFRLVWRVAVGAGKRSAQDQTRRRNASKIKLPSPILLRVAHHPEAVYDFIENGTYFLRLRQ